jgi:hypothetical protein
MTLNKDAFKMPYQELENEDEFISFNKNKSSEEPEHKKDIIHRLSEDEVQKQQPSAELGYD